MMRPTRLPVRFPVLRLALALSIAGAATSVLAQVKVENAWVRGAVPGQLATGAFVDLTSARDATLVKVESPVAAVVEVHASEMKDGMMTMRAAAPLKLPAGKQVRLAPGGNHIMLMDLKQPVKNGESVPISLTVEYADAKRETIEVSAQVRGLGTSAAQEHQHKH
ncbi:MAG: copper chaperone PCu(A)C [Betaproteobacteria bacterium]